MTSDSTNMELLKGFAQKGFLLRYGENPPKEAVLRMLYELWRIDQAGYAGHYLMAFWIFRYTAKAFNVNVWARGAMPSSIVCYSLMLTETDPILYGLHSARFVNDAPPKFQFDIEESRFGEFRKRADDILKANADRISYESASGIMFDDLQPSDYLSQKSKRPLPDDIDDETARYALSFPDTMELYHIYEDRRNGALWKCSGITQLDDILAPTCGLLAYQEQMFDILKTIFHVGSVKANDIRLSIQRGNSPLVETYRSELSGSPMAKDLGKECFDIVWSALTFNPKAFLKSHAVSRVVSTYHYDVRL